MTETHRLEGKPLSLCRCSSCDNIWFCVAQREFAPSYCCYCGIFFTSMDEGDGVKKTVTGFPLVEGEQE